MQVVMKNIELILCYHFVLDNPYAYISHFY